MMPVEVGPPEYRHWRFAPGWNGWRDPAALKLAKALFPEPLRRQGVL